MLFRSEAYQLQQVEWEKKASREIGGIVRRSVPVIEIILSVIVATEKLTASGNAHGPINRSVSTGHSQSVERYG